MPQLPYVCKNSNKWRAVYDRFVSGNLALPIRHFICSQEVVNCSLRILNYLQS